MQPTVLFCLLVFSGSWVLYVQCQTICDKHQYTIVTKNGSFVRCLHCDTCHPGRGLYPPCGSHIQDRANIECKVCTSGTFSAELDSAPCHSCQQCVEHEIIADPCTNRSDRNCSGTCEKGYFFAKKAPHNCQQCSYCCFDGNDEEQAECIKQGLNATGRHCSRRLDKQCGPLPTTVVTTQRTTVTNFLPTTTVTHLPPTTHPSTRNQNITTPLAKVIMPTHRHPSTKHKNHTTIIVLSALSGLFLAIIVIGAILFQRKSRIWRRKGRESNPPSIPQINAAVDSPTQNNHDDNYASQGPQSLEIRRDHLRVQALQNTGYASSASATPEVSPSATPQQTDDEVDELPNVIAVRNKRRLKRQSSRDAPRLPNNEGADESLLDPKLQAANEGNFRGEESKGGGPVKISRKHSLEALKRKFSFSLEKDDYQPLGEEDPDEPQGSGEVSSTKCSGLAFSLKSLQRKLSLSEKEQDYQPVGLREDPDEGECKNFPASCTEPLKIDGVEPMHQEQKEGSRVEFKCNVQGRNELFYQWFKDGTKMQGQNQSTLVLSCVELRDFGFYVCQVSGVNSQSDCMKSSAAVLDVVPRDGMSLRCLRDVDPNIKSNIETLLTNKVHGGGGWRQVAFKYEMDEHHIDSLEGNPDAGKSVISYLKATYPDLIVYDFCKTLRERNIRRFDIIQKLLGQLSVPAPEKAS